MFSESCIDANEAKELIPRFVEENMPRYLTEDEFSRLIESAMPNKRDNAIIQLLIQTGIKLSELTRLTINDLQITGEANNKGERVRFLRVVGNQRNKEREVPLNSQAGLAIDDYLSVRGSSRLDNIFLNKDGERMSNRGIETILSKYFKLAAVHNVSVKSLRHTFGTYQAIKGSRLKTIQKVMSHKDPRSTGIYFQLANLFSV